MRPGIFALLLDDERGDEGEEAVNLFRSADDTLRLSAKDETGWRLYSKGLDCTLVMLSTMLMDTFFLWDRGRNASKLGRRVLVKRHGIGLLCYGGVGHLG